MLSNVGCAGHTAAREWLRLWCFHLSIPRVSLSWRGILCIYAGEYALPPKTDDLGNRTHKTSRQLVVFIRPSISLSLFGLLINSKLYIIHSPVARTTLPPSPVCYCRLARHLPHITPASYFIPTYFLTLLVPRIVLVFLFLGFRRVPKAIVHLRGANVPSRGSHSSVKRDSMACLQDADAD